MQESFGGERNCVSRDWLWENPHSRHAYIRDAPLDPQTPKERMRVSCTHSGSGSTGDMLFYPLELGNFFLQFLVIFRFELNLGSSISWTKWF